MLRVPHSTYRLQLHAGFTFDDAIRIAPYLKALGVSHVYCSPYLQAAPGSMHGYDVVDQQCINAELGGEEAHQRFCARLAELGLGQILDIVPNHMAIGPQNKYWWDVLENGPSSRFATWFDIDWHSSEVRLQNKVLIPVLGDQYGKILAAGQIQIERDHESIRVRYVDNIYPLTPRSLSLILDRAGKQMNSPTLGFFADSLSRLPSPDVDDVESMITRHRDKEVVFGLLHRFCDEHPKASQAIDQVIAELNASHDALDDMLNQQHYRLAYWRTADQELGYRRFFDINTLVGLRVERSHVFNSTHRRILEWLDKGILDGVRVDHPDGLRDPLQYFARLRERAPQAWIIGEKILEPGEFLRPTWPIEGTSGYDFLNICNGLFMHPDGLRELTEIYSDFTREPTDFNAIAHDKKLTVEQEALGSDVNRIADLFLRICENNRDRRDYTRAEIRRAIRETSACFRVYRTYVVPDRDEITGEDRHEVLDAVKCANERRTDIDSGLFDFIAEVLLLRTRGPLETEFVQRFQQFTSPVMAKGVEDTAFYCYNRMVGLNEVGSAPGHDGISASYFHDYCQVMQLSRPSTMTTLSTHDTKRSDDVRARLAVITEAPGDWRRFLRRWTRQNTQLKTNALPDRNTEYFLYQTVIGAWPIEPDRLHAYMEKAVREAKQHTTWTQQNREFEDALHSFIDRLYQTPEFIAAIEDYVRTVLTSGRLNSLAQTLLNCVAPGVPDTYQGSELWSLHLVDPDNRRPVDYEIRTALLSEIESGLPLEQILSRMDSGLPKLWILHRALNLRREHPECFGPAADYTPLMATGRRADHVVAFLRAGRIAAIVPRWSLKLAGNWSGTSIHLPKGRWKNLLTHDQLNGGELSVKTVLQRFPVALLQLEEA